MFRAEAQSKALLFDTDGLLGGNEVFKDRETGSHWQQSSLQAISGPLKGAHLAPYLFLLTTWGEWHKQHPDTLVLKPLPGYADRLAAMNKIINQGVAGMAGPAPSGAFSHDSRLRPRETVIGLELGGRAKAFPLAVLREVRVVNDHVGGTPVLIVHQPAADTTTGFVARLNGKDLKFRPADPQAGTLVDLETHSSWSAYGRCISGQLKGSRLTPVILEPEFWFAWSEFHPETELYISPGAHKS